MEIFSFNTGCTPLVVSMPHSGEFVPDDIKRRMTETGHALVDTDWHVPALYDFLVDLGVSILQANYSRYVVDLNRPADGEILYPGQRETEICPTTTFMDQDIYLAGREPSASEIGDRKRKYWQPYHWQLQKALEEIKSEFGYALLWDAHSIQSQLPRFFEGRLTDLSMGTANGESCDQKLSDVLYGILQESDFSAVLNGRFKGGYITRKYGDPGNGVHAVQMEIAQVGYMSEYPSFIFDEEKAIRLRPVLRDMIHTMSNFPRKNMV